ncbi:MAG: transglutaminase-like domain-containing protein [Pseudomonadota bacterium]|nr:transglutaminase-like domain-containing protein [Pseudomonadota bacterium]
MMKRFLFFCVLFFSCASFGTSMGERRALSAPRGLEENLPQLVRYLTDNIPNQAEQAKAIAVWIASHISYDFDTFDGNTFKRKTTHKEQTANQVLKDKIGVCEGFADLYEKMLKLAGIRNEKVYGFVVEKATGQHDAKVKVKKEPVGHVWTKVNVLERSPIYVDTTWMSRGGFNITQRRHSEQRRKREIRQNKRDHKSHTYQMDYFDFAYSDLAKHGEYRFTRNRQLIKK